MLPGFTIVVALGLSLVSCLPLDEQKKMTPAEMVDYINKKSGAAWVATLDNEFIPKFTGAMVGLVESKSEKGKDKFKIGAPDWTEEEAEMDIPVEFDARTAWPKCGGLREIRFQSNCGDCWAIAAVEAMSDRICIATGGAQQPRLSVEELMTCCERCAMAGGCKGGDPYDAWEFWVRHGIVTGGNYTHRTGCQPYNVAPCSDVPGMPYPPCKNRTHVTPQCKHTCQPSYNRTFSEDKHYGQSAYRLPSDVATIQREIMSRGSVEAGFTVYQDFPFYKTGVYHHVYGEAEGGHAVKFIGWGVEEGTPYWLVANSWSTHWGDHGFFKILRGNDECGIESDVVAGIPFV